MERFIAHSNEISEVKVSVCVPERGKEKGNVCEQVSCR